MIWSAVLLAIFPSSASKLEPGAHLCSLVAGVSLPWLEPQGPLHERCLTPVPPQNSGLAVCSSWILNCFQFKWKIQIPVMLDCFWINNTWIGGNLTKFNAAYHETISLSDITEVLLLLEGSLFCFSFSLRTGHSRTCVRFWWVTCSTVPGKSGMEQLLALERLSNIMEEGLGNL